MSIRQRVPAGLIDSGCSSAATFAAGIYAVRYMDARALGIYSVFFSVFFIAEVIPTDLVFVSARVRLLALPPLQRLGAYRQTLSIGAIVSLISALVVGLALPTAISNVSFEFLTAMTFTAYVAGFVSPLQSHIRDLFHLASRSWGAAAVSAVHAAVVFVAIGAAIALRVDPSWVPFGALVVGNLMSLFAGLVMARAIGDVPPARMLRFSELRRSGGWFLARSLLEGGGDFVARSAIVAVAAPAVLGVATGARIVSRPLSVFVAGISSVVQPRSMQAGKDGHRAVGRRIARRANIGMLLFMVAYLGFAGVDWTGNLVARLAPIGYTVSGLVPATILAVAVRAHLFVQKGELMGGGRARELTLVELFASASYAASGLLAGMIGAFAMPLGMALSGGTRWIGFEVALSRHYREGAADASEVSEDLHAGSRT